MNKEIQEVFEEVKQTLEILEEVKTSGRYGCDLEMQIESEKIKLAALEKQIPFRPERYKGFYGQCKCKAVFLDKLTNYCGNCGQKLSWEVE